MSIGEGGWPVRWMRAKNVIIPDDELDRVRAAPLYRAGDMVLVWVNQGDILMYPEQDVPTP
jgi:hypothetical protein